ncbi:hypothetical protein QZH41_010673 [Actinostola sp. cb2023]|nr:hypothetical protein QZH41_010673 [Actinostola sp. cb2023]
MDKSKGPTSPSKGGSNKTALIASLVAVLSLVIIAIALVVAVVFWRSSRKNPSLRYLYPYSVMADEQIPVLAAVEQAQALRSHPNQVYKYLLRIQTMVLSGNRNEALLPVDDADLYGNAEAIRYQPIPVNKFYQYVNEKKASPNSFMDEFRLLSSGQLFPWDLARDPANKPRNRYANIITYDHSRVILQESSSGSDYVNASYIPVKCHQYWPEKKEKYGPLTVNHHRCDVLADYAVRTFILTKDDQNENRQVYHFQYTSWPDKGVPQHATSVLGFRRKARAQYVSGASNAPLLVHCSAGVGRTGAFIAVDAMLERAKKEKTVDIFNYVQLMRNNRITMVQTDEQYAFVHFALQEALTCGNTEIPVLNLNIVMARLSKPRPKDHLTGFEVQWKILNGVSPIVTKETSKAGRMINNRPRNRYQDIIPCELNILGIYKTFKILPACLLLILLACFFLKKTRITSMHRLAIVVGGSKCYVVLMCLQAYRERNAYIIAQAPMDNTMADFWHMIHQYKVGSIVMLNKLQENEETFPQYWPLEGTESYNGITVEVVSTASKGPLVTRKCVIIHPSEPNHPHNFIHIQHTEWPNQGVPNDCQSILDIVDTVQKSQQKSGNAPVVAQCSDGVGRSGTFCAVYSLLERVKSEQVIDVLQVIKVLRLGRPKAVETLEQYQFCYRMVQKYVESFNEYANFSEV